jgi:hypothetical protein
MTQLLNVQPLLADILAGPPLAENDATNPTKKHLLSLAFFSCHHQAQGLT